MYPVVLHAQNWPAAVECMGPLGKLLLSNNYHDRIKQFTFANLDPVVGFDGIIPMSQKWDTNINHSDVKEMDKI